MSIHYYAAFPDGMRRITEAEKNRIEAENRGAAPGEIITVIHVIAEED